MFLALAFVGFTKTQILAPMPAKTSVFNGNNAGYFFSALTCFTITGVQVPTDAGSSNQSITIVRFQTVPPTFLSTANNFTTLFLTQNNANSGILSLNIQVEQGDIFGVRGTANSYSKVGNTTSINGFSVPLARLGM